MDTPPLQLALAHHKAGQLGEAEAEYRQILAIEPRQPTVLNYYGVLAIQTNQLDLAVKLLRQAVSFNPEDANYRCNLGEALRRSSRMQEAIGSYREAIRLKPDLAVAHNNMGIALAAMKNFDGAILSYQNAIRIDPKYAEAHSNLGNALKECARYDEAVAECQIAVTLKPQNAEGHNQLGAALAELGEIDEAISAYQTAIRIDPSHADAHSNLGNALGAQGRVQDAIASCERAVGLRPDSIPAHWNFAVALLRAGDYERGFVEHEWRLKTPSSLSQKRFAEPAWDGRSLDGQTILLHAEQGFGDTIQFVRYVRMVAAIGGRVILQCQRELVRLFRGCAGLDLVISNDDPLPAFDEHAPLMSLPMVFRTRLETVPATVPYLCADKSAVGRWRERLASVAGTKAVSHVGLCWAGNSIHRDDVHRSIPVAELGPLAADGILLHSLQKEPAGPVPGGLRLIDHSQELTDFSETAALLANLDYVITVDTAVAHLSGALGVATAVLLAPLPDWRWMLHRQDSAWYPTQRLYRRRRNAKWREVLERVARDLGRMG